MDFFDFLAQNWSVIAANPATFVTLIGLTGLAVFGFAKLHYSGLITTLQARLDAAKEDKERLKEDVERLRGKESDLINALKKYEVDLDEMKERINAMEEHTHRSDVYQAELAELKARIEALPKFHVGPTELENPAEGDIWIKY